MPTEYIPKSLALDIIARLCIDYAAAYAEISAARGIEIVKCRDCVYGDWDSKPDDAMVCTHNGLSGWYSGDDFCSSGRRRSVQKETTPITETCYTCAAWHEGHKNNLGTCFNGNSPYCMTVMGADKTCEEWQGKWK